jgi:uncharacterized protein
MLWQVKNTNLRILGSVHVSNRSLYLPPLVADAINGADTLAFEANFEVSPNLSLVHYKKGNALSKNIPASLFTNTKELWLELGLGEEELENIRPWWAAFRLMNTVMSKHGFVHNRGIDRNVLNIGKLEKKNLFFLEAVGAGLEPFARAPLKEQEIFLSRVVQHTDEGVQEVASLVDAWESNNPNNLLPVVERALQLMPLTYSNALAGRNKVWLRHFLRLAQSQKKAVAIVGALHMVGPESIPSLLAVAGFTCSLVEVAQ